MFTCPICYIDIVVPKTITCTNCNFQTCKTCAKTYILSTVQMAHCMSCRVMWSYKFLYDNFDKSWINNTAPGHYRHHRKNISLEREKSKIPETLQKEHARKKAIEKQEEDIKNLKDKELNIDKEIAKLQSEINRLQAEKNTIHDQLKDIRRQNYKAKILNILFVQPCYRCRGLIDKETYKCVLCEASVCRSCLLPKNEDHKCTPEDIASAKLLKHDTRPCPQCATPIYKISGCDQMFCTHCHVTFSWDTGKLETGLIHNPYAIQWMREHHKNEDIANCANHIQIWKFDNFFDHADFDKLAKVHRLVGEIIGQIELTDHLENKFDELRLTYISNKIDEEAWKQSIFITERHLERQKIKNEIFTTMRTLMITRFHQLYQTLNDSYKNNEFTTFIIERNLSMTNFYTEVNEIRDFINQALTNELSVFGAKKCQSISTEWEWTQTCF
jgi:hypothetical protein